MQNTILILLLLLTALFILRLRLFIKPKKGLVVLNYFNIGAAPKNDGQKTLWVSAARFKKHLRLIRKKGFTFIGAQALGKPLKEQSALLTFACGFENFYTNAWPVLKEEKIPFLVFLTAGGVDNFNFWQDTNKAPWQNMLSAAQINTLAKSPLCAFGSYGLSGAGLRGLPADILENELKESALRLEKLYNIKPACFCFQTICDAQDKPALQLARTAYQHLFAPGGGVNALPLQKDALIDVIRPKQGDGVISLANKLFGK